MPLSPLLALVLACLTGVLACLRGAPELAALYALLGLGIAWAAATEEDAR